MALTQVLVDSMFNIEVERGRNTDEYQFIHADEDPDEESIRSVEHCISESEQILNEMYDSIKNEAEVVETDLNEIYTTVEDFFTGTNPFWALNPERPEYSYICSVERPFEIGNLEFRLDSSYGTAKASLMADINDSDKVVKYIEFEKGNADLEQPAINNELRSIEEELEKGYPVDRTTKKYKSNEGFITI